MLWLMTIINLWLLLLRASLVNKYTMQHWAKCSNSEKEKILEMLSWSGSIHEERYKGWEIDCTCWEFYLELTFRHWQIWDFSTSLRWSCSHSEQHTICHHTPLHGIHQWRTNLLECLSTKTKTFAPVSCARLE